MLIRFFDASALVKRYVRERGSDTVERLLASGDVAAISRLSEVEVASALARRTRIGDVTPEERDVALATLERDLASFVVVELVPDVAARARTLLNAYSLRASDAIQLASCHLLRERLDLNVPFVAFDERLVVVALESGATVLGAAGHGLKRR